MLENMRKVFRKKAPALFLRGGAFLSPRLINNHLSPLDITILYLLITMWLERSYWKNMQLTSHNIKKPAPVFVSGAGSHSPGKGILDARP